MSFQKDRKGKELIKKLCIPDHNGEFCYDPELLEQMHAYCKQDVIAERFAASATPPLTEEEHRDWVLLEKNNDRGIKIDRELAKAAAVYADDEIEEISKKLSEITDGVITSPRQFTRIKNYLVPHMEKDEGIRKCMTRVEIDRRSGEQKRRIACDRDARLKLLILESEHPGRLPEHIKTLIELLDDAGRSSVHKYRNMDQRAGDGDRVRGVYISGGAVQTGRHSSVAVQVHNLPRETAFEPEVTRKTILQGKPLTNGVMDTLSGMLRYSIMSAPGHLFVGGDWSSIEARILPSLTDDYEAAKVLNVFRRQDRSPKLPDIYTVAAAELFDIPVGEVTPPKRQIGKVCVLALGFGGGQTAFQSMARGYGISVSDDDAFHIVRKWRLANRWAVSFWADLEKASRLAVKYPGELHEAGRVKYCRPEENAPLYCELPSGRVLSYQNPKLEMEDGPGGPQYRLTSIKAQWKPKRGETDWGRINLYGGLLAENCTQAAAADLLRHAMRLADEDGWPVVATTHDEVLLEVRDDEAEEAAEALEAIMMDKPEWAKDMPLACKIWSGKRYSK